MSFREHERHHHHGHQPQYVTEEYCEEERVYAPPYERENSGCYDRTEGGHVYQKNYRRNERLGEVGAAAAGAFALYEGHEAKIDPAHAAKHRHEEEAATLGALGSGGYAYYEHRKKEEFKNDRFY